MDNGSLETLQGREVCWTGQVYHLSLACEDPAASAVKWYKNNLIIHFLFYGRKREGLQAHSCLALPGRVSESDSSVSGHVPQSCSDSVCKAISLHSLSAACLIHMNKVWSELSAPQHTQWSMQHDTLSALHPRISRRSQPDKKILCRRKAADRSLESWLMDSSVLLLQFGKREMFLDYALPAASIAQYADRGRRIKKTMRLLQRLFSSFPYRSEHGQNCT